MQHILIPTDFSKTAAAALNHALPMAELTGARVTLLHVVFSDKLNESFLGIDAIASLSKIMDLTPDSSRYTPSFNLAALRTVAKEKLDEIARNGGRANIASVVLEGRPSEEIIRFAEKNGVDLIVMGTHGRGPVGRMFLGSVAENVIRGTHCPVMVVRK